MNTRTAFAPTNPAVTGGVMEAGETRPFAGSMRPAHLLLPVDFSTCTRPAIQYTFRIADAFHARTTILAMNPPPWIHTLAEVTAKPEADESAGRRGRRLVRRLLGSLGLEHDGKNLQLLIRNGEPVRETILTATTDEADMVILTGLEKRALDIFRGGTTEKVARAARCPVLAIRQEVLVPRAASEPPEGARLWENILVAVNFTPGGRTALGCASSLATATSVRPTLLHVVEAQATTGDERSGTRRSRDATRDAAAWQLEQWSGAFAWPETPRQLVQAGLPVHEAITNMAARLGADLLVTGMRRCNRMQHIISDDTAAEIIGSAPCPVLVVPEDGR